MIAIDWCKVPKKTQTVWEEVTNDGTGRCDDPFFGCVLSFVGINLSVFVGPLVNQLLFPGFFGFVVFGRWFVFLSVKLCSRNL